MDRIAPRKRKNNRVCQPLLHSWLIIRQKIIPDPKNSDDQNLMSKISASEQLTITDAVTESDTTLVQKKGLKGLLLKIWHLPDSFQWMEPLPFFHRRWVIIATTVLLLALLWPASRNNTDRYLPANIQPTSVPLQAQRQDNPDATLPHPVTPETPLLSLQGNWQSYQIEPGKTLAQLFRDNNLSVNEVFAMAQVEGNDKPLSHLQAGQEVKIMLDAQKAVVALAIETSSSAKVLFTRQSDGSYRRDR